MTTRLHYYKPFVDVLRYKDEEIRRYKAAMYMAIAAFLYLGIILVAVTVMFPVGCS